MRLGRYKIQFFVLLITLFLSWFLGRNFYFDTDSLAHSLENFPLILSVILYILLYVVITFFVFFSKDLFWWIGAFFYGATLRTALICIAESLNALIFFYLARFLGRGYVSESIGKKYERLDEKLGKASFVWLFLLRATPLIPYRFLDLAAGLTRLEFKRYMAAVIIGTPIKTFWIQFVLAGTGRDFFNNPYTLVEYFVNNKPVLLVGLLYMILVVLAIFRLRAKKG